MASATTVSTGPPPDPPSTGMTRTMPTMARSWKISTARLAWPRAVPDSPRAARILSTMAVELRATRKPVKIAVGASTPPAIASPAVRAVASTTWSPPPPRISRRMRPSRSRENSMPIVNSRRMTPTSAATSTTSWLSTRPSWAGPIATPASRKPTIGTTRSRDDR